MTYPKFGDLKRNPKSIEFNNALPAVGRWRRRLHAKNPPAEAKTPQGSPFPFFYIKAVCKGPPIFFKAVCKGIPILA